MTRAYRRVRRAFTLGALLSSLLSWSPRALALNPALDVSQYAHTSWKIREGFVKGQINSIAQTSDGYLWLGTEFGLLRFDGVKNVPWQPPPGQELPSNNISTLLAARDGTLWIGTLNGLATWKDGKLTQYPDFAGLVIPSLLEDRDGSVWVSAVQASGGRVCVIHNSGVRCYGKDDGVGYVWGLFEGRAGSVWSGGDVGIWHWKPGAPKLYSLPRQPNGIQALAESDDGGLLVSMAGGVRRVVDGKARMAYPFPAPLERFEAHKMLRDKDGGLWIGTSGGGLLHAHQGRTDLFTHSAGLSGDKIGALFEDRERNIWVATNGGLDRFREFAVTTFSVDQGLSNATVTSVLAARDGSVWVGTFDGLNRWNQGQLTIYRERAAQTPPGVREVTGKGLPAHGVHSLFQDDRGRIWISNRDGLSYLENERVISVPGTAGDGVNAITGDSAGGLWIAKLPQGLTRVSSGDEIQLIPWSSLAGADSAIALLADSRPGGLWLGFRRSGIAYLVNGQVRARYSSAEGMGLGLVSGFRLERDGALWVWTEGGLSRLKNGRIATLSSKHGLPCDTVHWVVDDDDRSSWLYMSCGLVRVAKSDLDAWAAAIDGGKDATRPIHATLFDSSDGVGMRAQGGGYTPQVGKSPDGKLWFMTRDGVGIVDPPHLPFNKLPPPVHIEKINADRKSYTASSSPNGRVRLPALSRDLEIDYTALSLVAPEKLRFRYKLEGWDRDWQDVGSRRQAFYANLPPRDYRFRVSASNNDGVWNEAGAFLDFAVAPAYYQTALFRLSCVAALLALLAGLYRLRVRQMAQRLNIRMEERVNERTRIARDLHDTLLQGFQGVLLKFHAVTYLLPDHPAEARNTLGGVIDQARQAITEGRDAVQGLRSSTLVSNDLAHAISTFGEALAADHQNSAEFRVQVEGIARHMPPLVRDEVYRTVGEALRNAFRHAHASRIEVDIRYDQRQFRLRVRDDGKGIDAQILSEGRRIGHHGLPGMNERAKLVGGKLTVWSELDSGTELELIIPAPIAYAKSSKQGT